MSRAPGRPSSRRRAPGAATGRGPASRRRRRRRLGCGRCSWRRVRAGRRGARHAAGGRWLAELRPALAIRLAVDAAGQQRRADGAGAERLSRGPTIGWQARDRSTFHVAHAVLVRRAGITEEARKAGRGRAALVVEEGEAGLPDAGAGRTAAGRTGTKASAEIGRRRGGRRLKEAGRAEV